ncbi:MAG: hypothetical protein ABIT83_05180 [Massilia sp.]
MDNQKTNDGNARDLGREGAGSSMGKDLNANKSTGGGVGGSSGSPGNTGANLAKDMSKSADDLHKTIDKAADAAQPVVDRLASSAHAGVDRLSASLAGAGKTVDEKSRQLTDAYGKFANTGREYVRSSPATSILVAVGAGFILSKLLGGRR